MNGEDRRLIEDRLPIAVINKLAQREKIGHIAAHPRKLHMWWARRPLAATRAAVYATLIPADSRSPEADAGFFGELCRWDVPEAALRRARDEILSANGGRAPKVLDMFAGGGAIPLEAVRLGCEATAIELNPVAHLIQKCMLEYPQRFPGLAEDIRTWGRRWVDRAWERLAELYPEVGGGDGQGGLFGATGKGRRPLAYLWTGTVRCPNLALAEHDVPLVRQTWLAKRKGRYVALRPIVDRTSLRVAWAVVEAATEAGLGFDPAAFSKRSATTCLACGAALDADYVRNAGRKGETGIAPLAAVVLKSPANAVLPAGWVGVASEEPPDDAHDVEPEED